MNKDKLKDIFQPSNYEVDLFKQKDFTRKICSNCATNFWTIDPDRTTCGDTPCEGGYQFIGKKTTNLDFHQMLDRITTFFEKHGHTSINPYPTVARWRDDLDFTIASIADFQPWVTNGTLPPPANPLVVPQPCIRFGGDFSDIDNVGRTGRHLTSFIMFGQHSFNSENTPNGYWMDRCIELNFDFLTSVLNIHPNDLTYIEGIWSGGGNFGPNLETFAFGTELVNSVFMQYELLNNQDYREMPLKVIDVGWGLERLSWFSQGTPTIYDAVFGPVQDYLLKETGIQFDSELITKYSKLAGLIDVNEVKDLKMARSNIAKSLGYTLDDLNSQLKEIEALYAIGDHCRTLAFTLADGAIPSNVGGNYNLRTLLRRIFTLNETMKFELDISDLIYRSAQYLSLSFPRVIESSKFASSIVNIEYDRYRSNIEKGEKHVKSLLKQNISLSDKTLVELYTSKGISPETISQIAKNKGINIDIPLDFYQQVENKVTENPSALISTTEFDLELVKDYNTKLLYYDDKPQRNGIGTILAILDTSYIILDKTIFYPIGGGQAEDRGWIISNKNKYEIINVEKYGNAVLHKIAQSTKNLKVGQTIEMELDWDRRLSLMRHHTAVHIVGGAARKILGSHVWQAGADKTPDRGRLDITHWENVSRETLDEIEYVANQVVMENKKIHKHVLDRTTAEEKYGFTIYQGGVVPGKELRIIEIPGIDIEACGGTHAHATGDLGYIRITGSERIQDGIVRITLKAGKQAVGQSQHDYQLLTEASNHFKVTPSELPKTSERFFKEWKDKQKTIDRLSKELVITKVPTLIHNAKLLDNNYKLIVERFDAPQSDLIYLSEQFSINSEKDGNLLAIVVGIYDNRALISISRSKGSDIPHNAIMKKLAPIIGGGGGGKGDVISGGGTKTDQIDFLISESFKIVNEIF